MKGKRNLFRSLQQRTQKIPKKEQVFSGLLGIRTNGVDVVESEYRLGFVWVRLRGVSNEVILAQNEVVSPIYNLPVLVVRDNSSPTKYKIMSRDSAAYGSNWGTSSAYITKHGTQHSFDKNNSQTGGDVVWVYGDQFTPALASPSGTFGASNVITSPWVYYNNLNWVYAGNTGTASVLPYKPPTADKARMVLLYLDKPSGNFLLASGTLTEFDESITGTSQVLPYIPSPPENSVPIAGIRLVTGTSTVGWNNSYDVRPYYYFPSTGTAETLNTWIDYTALSGTVNTGSILSGTVSNTQEMYDGNTWIIGEATGVPGYDIQFEFYNITQTPNFVIARWLYDGSATHFVTIDMYNYTTGQWDTLRKFVTSNTYFDSMTMYTPIINQENYVQNEQMRVRFYHRTTGNASHDIHIDYVGFTYKA